MAKKISTSVLVGIAVAVLLLAVSFLVVVPWMKEYAFWSSCADASVSYHPHRPFNIHQVLAALEVEANATLSPDNQVRLKSNLPVAPVATNQIPSIGPSVYGISLRDAILLTEHNSMLGFRINYESREILFDANLAPRQNDPLFRVQYWLETKIDWL